MTWTINDRTTPVYNMKDQYGNYVLWNGVSLDSFSRCEIHWKKQSKTINDLVKESFNK